MDTSKLLSEQINGLRASIDSMPEDAPLKPACMSFLNDTVHTLSNLQKERPQAHEQAERLALYLSSLATCLAGHYATQIQGLQEEKSRRAEITNEKSRIVADVARAIAFEVWDSDKNNLQQYRMTDTAKIVRAEMDRLGFVQEDRDGKEGRPTLRTVKRWISEIAPEHAHRHGAEKADCE